MFCSLRINGQVEGKRSVNNTAGDLSFLAHLCQLGGLYGYGHFRVNHLNSGQRGYLGGGNAAGMSHFYGIFNNMYLVLQRRVGHECHVGEEQQLVDAGDIEYAYMGKRISGSQANLFVKNTL